MKVSFGSCYENVSAVQCLQLPLIPDAGEPHCSNGRNFRSICSYNCPSGYGMPTGVSKTVVCRNDETWSYNGQPSCIGNAILYRELFVLESN